MKRVDFFSQINKNGDNGCWLWQGKKDNLGYGRYGKQYRAHRWSYEYHKGPIPEGLQIDHLCRNRACVNPDHLEAVTKKENTLRSLAPTAINARKTHCYKGHPFDERNTYVTPEGWRTCRACKNEKHRRRRTRLRNEKAS